MAHVYVDSNAAGAGTGADWANAYTTLSAAATAKAAGDNFWVAHNHAESTAGAVTITFPGTAASPNTCICVNSAGTVPPVAADIRTTATVTSTGANNINITTVAGGCVYIEGILFNCGSGAVSNNLTVGNSAVRTSITFKNCSLKKNGTTGSATAITFGGTDANNYAKVVLDNCTLSFGATSDQLSVRMCDLTWRNTATPLAGSAPTTLFDSANLAAGLVLLTGVDLSGFSGTLVEATSLGKKFLFKNCKLHATVTLAATPTGPGWVIDSTNCDSGDTQYRNERYSYMGTLTTETTVVRTGGASDGTTPIAWKIVTTANSEWVEPFECPPIAVWNETLSSITLTVQGIWGGGAVPNNDEIWIDVEYLGTSGFPVSSFATSNKATYLTTAAALAAGSGTWGGSTTKFAMSATFTPAEKGFIYVTVKAATASSTFYVDPKPVIS
jgi:hypothetical protein